MYLPANFFCATVFFELRKEHEKDFAAMNELVNATMIRRFYGGIILRAETLEKYSSGKITFRNENVNSEPNNNSSLSFWSTSKCLKDKDDQYFSLSLTFWEQHFPEFAFDILALLKNTYQPNVLSSLYCTGSTALENGGVKKPGTLIRKATSDTRKKQQPSLKQKVSLDLSRRICNYTSYFFGNTRV